MSKSFVNLVNAVKFIPIAQLTPIWSLHTGQAFFLFSHSSIHSWWKTCSQNSFLNGSLWLSSTRQIVHLKYDMNFTDYCHVYLCYSAKLVWSWFHVQSCLDFTHRLLRKCTLAHHNRYHRQRSRHPKRNLS